MTEALVTSFDTGRIAQEAAEVIGKHPYLSLRMQEFVLLAEDADAVQRFLQGMDWQRLVEDAHALRPSGPDDPYLYLTWVVEQLQRTAVDSLGIAYQTAFPTGEYDGDPFYCEVCHSNIAMTGLICLDCDL